MSYKIVHNNTTVCYLKKDDKVLKYKIRNI